MNLPDALTAALDVEHAEPVPGGDLNDAYRVTLADERVLFVKTRQGADRQEFVVEAQNLGWLAEARALPVPELVLAGEEFLALEWVEAGRLSAEGEEEHGRGLANLHRCEVPFFGSSQRMHLGPVVLPNDPCGDWGEFYAERRLMPLARRLGMEDLLAPLCARLHHLGGPLEPPALLHGDLWTGNVHADQQGTPWLIDPASYGGHREVDLAMLELFGGRNARVLAAYQEVHPLADGWEERIPLWQLFPLLVHAALFGGTYGAQVERVVRRLS